MKNVKLIGTLIIFLLSGCSTLSAPEKSNLRMSLDKMSEDTIAELVKKEDSLQVKLDKALAYAVADMKVTKVPVVGAGTGQGVFVIQSTKERVYFKVKRFDIGGGWGARAYQTLILFNTQELVEQWKNGEWVFKAGAEVSAGSAAAGGGSSSDNKDFSIHILAGAGASATATARLIRIKTVDLIGN